MFSARTIVLGVPLLVISGLAAQVIFGSKVTGDMVAAHYGDQLSSVNVVPVDTADGRAYAVFWYSCTLNPDFSHRLCVSAGGLAPRSAIKTQQIGQIGLDLDTSILSVVFAAGGLDCTTGTCIPFTPASVPLNGTFTILQGPGSHVEQFNGSTRTEDMLFFGGVTFSSTFSGSRTDYSANFAGTVGLVTVTPPPIGFNGSVSIMKGQQTFQTVYPPI